MPAQIIDKDALLKKLAATLKSIRKEKGISQEKLAETSRLSREYVGRLERDNANVSILTLCQICNALEVKPSEILTRVKL